MTTTVLAEMTATVLADMLRDLYRLLCQIEDEYVVMLVCTPDGQPLNSAMLVDLEWVQELRSWVEAQLEERR